MKTTFIYSLSDPDTGKIRYVGKADCPQSRLKDHCKESAASGTFHRATWIRSLLRKGKRPTVSILTEVPISEWQHWEREFIRVLRAAGADLTNSTDGGDGVAGLSPETRKKIAIANTGRKVSLETRAKQSAAKKGKPNPASPARCAAISAAKQGKTFSAEHKAALSAAKKGKQWSGKRRAASQERSLRTTSAP